MIQISISPHRKRGHQVEEEENVNSFFIYKWLLCYILYQGVSLLVFGPNMIIRQINHLVIL